MKIIIAFICSFTLFLSSSKLTMTNDEVILSIDKKATNEQLADFKQQLAKRKIVLNIEKVERSSNDEIKFIKISVDCNDGFKGSLEKTFSDEAYAIGFYRSYKADAVSPFGMKPTVED